MSASLGVCCSRTPASGVTATTSPSRVSALTGLRAVAALLVVGTHAAFATGKLTHGYVGAIYAHLEVGVAIFFVLTGFLLFRPWVRAAAGGSAPPDLSRYARHRVRRILPGLRGDGVGGLRAVHRFHSRSQPRAVLVRIAPLPHVYADLHRRLPHHPVAHGPLTNVEPGRRGLLLRRAPRARLCAAASGVPGPVATAAHTGRSHGARRDHTALARRRLHHRIAAELGRDVATRPHRVVRGRHGVGRSRSHRCPVPRDCCDQPGDRSLSRCLHTVGRTLWADLCAGDQVADVRGHRDARGGAGGTRLCGLVRAASELSADGVAGRDLLRDLPAARGDHGGDDVPGAAVAAVHRLAAGPDCGDAGPDDSGAWALHRRTVSRTPSSRSAGSSAASARPRCDTASFSLWRQLRRSALPSPDGRNTGS